MSGFPPPRGCALPGLRCALDAGFVHARIAAALLAPSWRIVALELDHVRCTSSDDAVAGWRVTTACGSETAAGHVTARVAPAWRIARECERLGARPQDIARAGLSGVAADERHEVLLVAFPVDRVLRELPRALRRARGELVAYRPEARAVLRSKSDYVHVRARPLGGAELVAGVLAERAGLHCAAMDGAAGDRVVRESGLEGAPFRGEAGAARALGEALARLHAQDDGGALPRVGVIDELDASLRACRDLAFLDPALGERAFELVAALGSAPPENQSSVVRHGALTGERVRVQGNAVALRGFCRAARGPAARDLATLTVDLIARGIDPTPACDALLDGYRRAIPDPDLAWFVANAALQASTAAFGRGRADWPRQARRLLDAAAEAAAAMQP